MLRIDDFLKSHILLRAWREGRIYGGYRPTLMIVSTIMNRVRLGWGSHLDVLNGIPKYAACPEPEMAFPNIWDADFTQLLHRVDGVYDGSVPDESQGALYWCDLRNVTNEWFKANILDKPNIHSRVADFNSLTFFK